jgi:uncharacterized phage protein gp47/JayE
MSGLTPEGLIIQRLSDILAAQEQKAIEIFQDIVPVGDVLDTSENTAIGRLIAIAAPSIADLWEGLEEVNSSFDPDAAEGIALDKLVKLGGVERFGARQAVVQGLFTGSDTVVIPMNSAVRANSNNTIWRTRSSLQFDVTMASGVIVDITTVANSTLYEITYTTPSGSETITYTSDGSATKAEILAGLIADTTSSPHLGVVTAYVDDNGKLNIDKVNPYLTGAFTVTENTTVLKVKMVGELQNEVAGVVTQPINTVTTIATPVLNWDAVTNFTTATGGLAKETDDELRIRFRDTKYERASNILEALYSALKSTEGVEEVVIYENDGTVTDGNGVPPHSFMPVVSGTADLVELANVVWKNKPIGIKSFSLTTPSTIIYDSQGFPHSIGIELPTDKQVYISINLTTDSNFPADGNAQVKQALIDYFANNFGIGDDVIYSRLYTPINSVPGHQVDSLTIGFSASPVGTSNLTIGAIEIARVLSANIIIT